MVAPTGVWTRSTNSWKLGRTQVTFIYQRRDGREFVLVAHRYSPTDRPASRYIYQPVNDGAGPPVIKNGKLAVHRYDNFAWRNGDQAITVPATPEISAAEIETIRAAMQGVSLPTVVIDPREVPSSAVIYRLVKP
jgi:hypothetical protein